MESRIEIDASKRDVLKADKNEPSLPKLRESSEGPICAASKIGTNDLNLAGPSADKNDPIRAKLRKNDDEFICTES